MSLSQQRLHEILDFNPQTGVFVWKISPRENVKRGTVAGWHNGKKMRRISIGHKCYLLHRLAWFYVHGKWPDQIDHINGDRTDNRLKNLRPATNSQNQANNGAKSNSQLGIRGVSARGSGFVVQLYKTGTRGQKRKIRARFTDLNEAAAFARRKSILLHGEFSVHSRSVP